MIPIKTEFFTLTKNERTKNRLFIGIDSGNSLTKIIFLNKNNKEEFLNEKSTTFTLQFSLFSNRHFEDAIQFIKMNAFQLDDNNDYGVHITGVFAISNGDKIKSILNKEIIFIDEMKTIITGYQIALENIGLENILAKEVQVKGYEQVDNIIIDRITASLKAKFKDEIVYPKDKLYPCLFCIQGSCTGFLYFDVNGKPEFISGSTYGGKSFLGLAKCLLDTNNYDEVVGLASRADKSGADTFAKDMLDEDIDSPYGKFPPYLPLLYFGRCADQDKGLSDFSKEEIALSLVAYHILDMLTNCSNACVLKTISRVYLSGNIFSSDIFQREIVRFTTLHPKSRKHLEFLNFGYFGVLGAIFSDRISLESEA